ncbi:MAG TPA: NGG1p interacting factor NIF3 [Candidatus Wallbacteria bacterium]|nr:MAG: NIF3 (NGG1p interacting factor 3) [bacterium ADurb.Bin243]HOD41910.1 NGG1p interacting factor NIF3 [Candidatus Wallbacteria bacterium]HPG59139.1 NGG1p interacting factor NIF3 [Candidatus Wallbacteria bacterium]
MKLQEFYRSAVALGIEYDPRGPAWVKKALQRAKDEYNRMTTEEKVWAGKEHTINPYDDTRVLHGEPDVDIKNKILVGIDIGIGEILVADKLRQRGKKIDLIVAHHPEGKAYAKYHTVIQMQAEILHKFGIPINIADGILSEKMREVENRALFSNINRDADIAALLDISFMCIHTPADNAVTTFLQRLVDKEKPERLSDILALLKTVPEYKEALKRHYGPKIMVGDANCRAGKIFVDMIGGEGTSPKIYEKLAAAGIGTIITTCMSEEHRKEAAENHLSVIAAGTIASDSLGLNLILDKILDQTEIDVVECSGFRRFSHK